MSMPHSIDSEETGPETTMAEIGRRARAAAKTLAVASTETKNAALQAMAAAIRDDRAGILAANEKDVAQARSAGLRASMIDRLLLDETRIEAMAKGLEDIAKLDDPIGAIMAGMRSLCPRNVVDVSISDTSRRIRGRSARQSSS